jgi:hypothetical protein
MSLFAISYMAMWILVLLLFAAVVLLYRELGRKLATRRGRLDEMGPEVGKEVAVSVAEVGGGLIGIGEHGRGWSVVIFTAPGCAACKKIQPLLREGTPARWAKGDQVVLIHHGDEDSTRVYIENMGSAVFGVADPGRELAQMWGVRATPFFVVIDEGGRVRKKGTGRSRSDVAAFLDIGGAA